MRPLITLACAVLLTGMASAQPVKVANAAELNKANESARQDVYLQEMFTLFRPMPFMA